MNLCYLCNYWSLFKLVKPHSSIKTEYFQVFWGKKAEFHKMRDIVCDSQDPLFCCLHFHSAHAIYKLFSGGYFAIRWDEKKGVLQWLSFEWDCFTPGTFSNVYVFRKNNQNFVCTNNSTNFYFQKKLSNRNICSKTQLSFFSR